MTALCEGPSVGIANMPMRVPNVFPKDSKKLRGLCFYGLII
jgi:hypothetical protein